MDRWQRSLDLATASWPILRADRELLALPVPSFAAWRDLPGAFQPE